MFRQLAYKFDSFTFHLYIYIVLAPQSCSIIGMEHDTKKEVTKLSNIESACLISS
jgi:hypothetical protein